MALRHQRVVVEDRSVTPEWPRVVDLLHRSAGIPVSRRISRRPRKNFGLAAVEFGKPPAKKEMRLSRRFSAGLADDAHHKRVNLTISPAKNTNKIMNKWL